MKPRSEFAILAVGLILRLLMPFSFAVGWGLDYWGHLPYVRWYQHNWVPPPTDLTIETFHPPGYYWLAGGLLRLGVSLQSLSWVSALSGCARLIAIFLGLRLVFPDKPTVRRWALALAVILPSSLQVDGTMSAEALHGALAACALLLVIVTLRLDDPRRFVAAAAAGLIIGLQFLTKVSGVVMLATFVVAAGLDALFSRSARRLAPWLLGALFAVAIAAPQARASYQTWGHLFPSAFDSTQAGIANRVKGVPVWERRPPDFYLGWQPSFFEYPFPPEDKNYQARFLPTMVASTFLDHYASFFVWPAPTSEKPLRVNFRLMPASAMWPARLAFAGGTILFVAVVPTFLLALFAATRRREAVWLACLFLPALAIFAQLQFAVVYPFDDYGVIKGQYTQFAAPPLYALVGVAIDWLRKRVPAGKIAAGVIIFGIALVAAYTFFARGVALMHPLAGT